MRKAIKYAILKTMWGYFGLAGTEFGLLRTCLPGPEREKVKSRLLKNLSLVNPAPSIEFDKTLFKTTQEQVTAYFEGYYVNFDRDIPIVLDGFSTFASRVLTACRDIKFGQTVNYGQLAKMAGRPAAASPVRNSIKGRKPQKGKISNGARAVGGVLAKNPLPLIIPCHRVIRSDGKIGGFSALGGAKLKAKLLQHEQKFTC